MQDLNTVLLRKHVYDLVYNMKIWNLFRAISFCEIREKHFLSNYLIPTYALVCAWIYTKAIDKKRVHTCIQNRIHARMWWLICERPASIDRADQWHRLPRVSLFAHPTPSSCNVHVRDPLELSDWHIRFQLSNACCRKQVQYGEP